MGLASGVSPSRAGHFSFFPTCKPTTSEAVGLSSGLPCPRSDNNQVQPHGPRRTAQAPQKQTAAVASVLFEELVSSFELSDVHLFAFRLFVFL